MSSPTAADDAVTVADSAEKPQRRFPPPCWTQEETLVLIEAYRERWYALRRGYLRTADWDAVAAAVASHCPGASPAKTSAQCRHKMEKLRQRYRAEKQRAISFPHPGGRYFSSWFFFENMEAMENGTAPPATGQKQEDSADGSRLKSFMDQNIVKLKLKSKNSTDPDPELGFANGVKPKRFNSGAQIPIDYSPYSNAEIPDQMQENISHDHDLANCGSRSQKASVKSRAKNPSKMLNNFNISDGFNHQLFPAPMRIRKLENFEANMDPGSIRSRHSPNEEFWAKFPVNHKNNNSGGAKRARSAVEEIVSSIKMLGEGFVRMENAKMEMAREMEAARMEMEMKRNQVLLESQKQIVDAFLKGLFELKKSKKIKAAPTPADSAH
ncbi:trihelix transcription factor ASIL2-like [Salvia miltiorrhiza]|uniref:trihelix transcription factor ASIL2-like n=1 Tax=Salvia miltiorrhiza TaxID=226208 RepID=UPI0025ABC460|nr:trihelix transcription factor ASIL2-like [Salvia miltiorrhiza]